MVLGLAFAGFRIRVAVTGSTATNVSITAIGKRFMKCAFASAIQVGIAKGVMTKPDQIVPQSF